MKKLFITVIFIAFTYSVNAQFDLGGKITNKVNQKLEQKIDQSIDEGVDEGEDGAKNSTRKKDGDKEQKGKKDSKNGESKSNNDENSSSNNSSKQSSSPQQDFKSYSKFDFVPGDKVMYFEDFSQDNVGDFPDKWNTNGSGEVVTLGNMPGKWLKTTSEIKYAPMLNMKSFPDNYTIEYDAIFKADEEQVGGTTFLTLDIFSSPSGKSLDAQSGTGIQFLTQGDGVTAHSWHDQQQEFENAQDKQLFAGKNGKVVHFSAWVQKQRCRLYVGETKVWDLPMIMPAGANCNAIAFGVGIYGEGKRDVFLSNIRIAVGAPDMRNKLMTDGKLVTHGILFDVNSDKIKGESYGTLKEISQVLKDNGGVKVKIVGHTDSDGDDKSNLDLSKRRAASVKASLSKDFGIDASRMETDGKGESEPASANSTSEGKANNRRVEFIKL